MAGDKSALVIKLSTEAIWSLLGDTPETRLEIASHIVQQFTHRYLKDIVNTEAVQEVGRVLKGAVQQEVYEQVGSYKFPRAVELTPSVKNTLTDEIKSQVGVLVETLVRAEVEKVMDRVPAMIALRVRSNIATEVDSEVKRRLNAALQG